jgi:hypothetical protein
MDDDSKVPPVSDPSWRRRAAPLQEFLKEPRTWKEIDLWGLRNGKSETLLRHLIAWLEDNHLVYSYDDGKSLRWLGAGGLRKVAEVVPEKLPDLLVAGGPPSGELDEAPIDSSLGHGDREGEGDDDPLVPLVTAPED